MTRPDLELRLFDGRIREEAGAALVGVDEVGRGCLAGPVVAAAVILPADAVLPGLDDSKRLDAERRAGLTVAIRAVARAIGVSFIGPRRIDAINIRQASLAAMRRAILRAEARLRRVSRQAHTPVDSTVLCVLVDGNDVVPDLPWPQRSLIGGDRTSLAIAAASVIAKTCRDGFMVRLALDYPDYGFEQHKGYGTPEHLSALARHGPCRWHRYSFTPVAQATLF